MPYDLATASDELDELDRQLRHFSRPRLTPDPDARRKILAYVGAAGTGKTTIGIKAANRANAPCLTFTNRNVANLLERGAVEAMTVHRFLYVASSDENGRLRFRLRKNAPTIPLAYVDEGLRLEPQIWRDLCARCEKIITSYDPNQLGNGGAFLNQNPVAFTLRRVRRQTAGSQPLLLATSILEGAPLPVGVDTEGDYSLMLDADIVLCALHDTRNRQNSAIRWKRHGLRRHHRPIVGERLICTRTNYEDGVYYGTFWTVAEAKRFGAVLRLTLWDDTDERVVFTPDCCFNGNDAPDPYKLHPRHTTLDYGYVTTVFRAQGSEWDRVCVLDETRSWGFQRIAREAGIPLNEYTRKWVYTAVTRARKHVDIEQFS